VENAADAVRRDDARDSDLAEIGIDARLGEHGPERVHRIALLLLAWLDAGALFDVESAILRDERAAALDISGAAAARLDLLAQRERRRMHRRSRARRCHRPG